MIKNNTIIKSKLGIIMLFLFFFGCQERPPASQIEKTLTGRTSRIQTEQALVDEEKGLASGTGQNDQEENGKNEARMLFVGDIMLDRYVRVLNERNKNECFSFEKIGDFLKNFDVVVGNNEGTITKNDSVSVNAKMEERNHFRFTFDPGIVNCYRKNNIGVVSIGNNHILDFGKEGLEETIKNLSQGNIAYFGNPDDKEKNVFVNEYNGVKIGIIAYNQFFGSSKDEVLEQIKKIKSQSDFVVLYCHWGIEYEKGSASGQREFAHRLVDAGADIVIGTHPHVVEEKENFKGKMIYYSLGNFIFDQYFSPETQKGLGVEVIFKKGKAIETKEYEFNMKKSGQVERI